MSMIIKFKLKSWAKYRKFHQAELRVCVYTTSYLQSASTLCLPTWMEEWPDTVYDTPVPPQKSLAGIHREKAATYRCVQH